jgi:UDP-N-acetylglucosamine/UDP-N-acetylgalactosamine diphosphorylase
MKDVFALELTVRYEQLRAACAAYGQLHLLQWYEQLDEAAQSRLLNQIESIDLEAIASLYEAAKQPAEVAGELAPMPAIDWESMPAEEQQVFAEQGLELLRTGKVGALVVAGGQGSRLGHPGPKGTFSIGLPKGESLFQLQAERLLDLSNQAGFFIPWYVMTSPENHDETVQFFSQHVHFGYPSTEIFFFQQAVLPAMDTEGRILLAAKDQIALTPSGNGEVFASLARSGALQDMKRRGLEWIFYYNVDNALIQVADTRFLGVASHHNHPIATKAARKAYPEEKVGILCKRNGRPAVVEYTDVPKELMYASDEQGELIYGVGNISIHLFRLDWIERHAGAALPYHAAFKKIPYLNGEGALQTPSEPNAYKFERFIFDFFPLVDHMTVLLMNRDEEFAPVKNQTGADSPETARQLVLKQQKERP